MQEQLSDLLEEAAQRYSTAPALRGPDGGLARWGSVFASLLAFAGKLDEVGLAPGDLVLVNIPDPVLSVLVCAAAVRHGAMVTTISEKLLAAAGRVPDLRILPADAALARAGDIRFSPDWFRPPRRKIPVSGLGGMVRSSSGTTGLPKLRFFSERALAFRVARGLRHREGMGGPAFLGYAPASSPWVNGFLRLAASGRMALSATGDDQADLRAIDETGVTEVFVSPLNFARLLAASEACGIRPVHLQRIVVGGGAVASAAARRAEAHFGCEVRNTYGSNETGSIAHGRPSLNGRESGRIGPVYQDVGLRFRDAAGRPADPAAGGSILIRPPAGSEAVDYPSLAPLGDADGWIDTGDLGYLDGGGALVLTGRKSELLNIGGNKRAPGQFEDALRDFPGLADLAAFRLPHASGVDQLGLAVVADATFSSGEFTDFARRRFGPDFPTTVFVVDAIPMTAAGKVDRRKLTETFDSTSHQLAETS